jgi:magnesium-transporting ATPase (P-type)
MTQTVQRVKSPLSRELDRVVRAITLLAVGSGVVCLGVGLLLGLARGDGFLFAVGNTVALVPEGLLPTVTLSPPWSWDSRPTPSRVGAAPGRRGA